MDENKRCPFCDEPIRLNAIKCKHCSSMLTDPPSPSGSLTGIDLVRQALGDRYEVLHELGRGGMATVYKAIQKNLNRPVALKVIHQNLVHDEEFVKRFHREAQVCASLQHPNIVTVYDEGEVSGVHFLAMEYLEGTDLRELLVSRGRLSQEETLRYMLPIAEALDYAHGRGLIHRDIKSSNIFICHAQTPSANTGDYHGGVTRTLDPEPAEGSLQRGNPTSHSTGTGYRSALRVVLMDFGIAHAAAGTQLTRAGAIIGTPEYMSPEQAAGQKVDHRTDLYSLGVVMYECLSGQVPFKGDSAASIIYRVIHEQVDHTGLDDIPPGLRALLSGLMSKKPSGRLASAGSTVEAILQIQQGKDRQPTPATGPQPSPRPESPPPESTPSPSPEPSPSRREKSTNTAALYWVVGIIGLIILVVWISNYNSRRQAAEQEAIANENRSWQQAQEAKTIASYEAYLEEYPRGRYASQANNAIQKMQKEAEEEAEKDRDLQAWDSARQTNSKASYEAYLRGFPRGQFASQARNAMERITKEEAAARDRQAWDSARQTNSKASYEAYLRDFPRGQFASQARNAMERITKEEAAARDRQAWNTAQTTNTIAAYETYLRNFPGGQYADQARSRKRDLEKPSGTFIDRRDNQTYKWVRIGNQVWMAENLNYNAGSGSWCYDNSTSNCNTYGRLYDWQTARNACPPGWRLPSDAEWTQLTNFVGSNAGTKLKAKSGWVDGGNGTDDFGFSALPGGYRRTYGSFGSIGFYGFWWSSTEYSSAVAWVRDVFHFSGIVVRSSNNKSNGFSLRCVREP